MVLHSSEKSAELLFLLSFVSLGWFAELWKRNKKLAAWNDFTIFLAFG